MLAPHREPKCRDREPLRHAPDRGHGRPVDHRDRRDDQQRRIAEAYIKQLDAAHAFPRPIATRVDPLKGFYAAEGHHQDYLFHNPDAPYIAMFDMPKVNNFKRVFPDLYSPKPVLTTGSP